MTDYDYSIIVDESGKAQAIEAFRCAVASYERAKAALDASAKFTQGGGPATPPTTTP